MLALFQLGRGAECGRAIRESLRVKHEPGDILGTAFALEIQGWLAARGGCCQRAAWLLGAADPLWARAGRRLASPAVMERLRQQAVGQCRDALGEEQVEVLFARAARYPLDRLVTFALGDGDEPAGEGASPGSRVSSPPASRR